MKYNNDLYHHGIIGQKWGIRRYQNKDGSLTDAGRRRANKDFKGLAKEIGRNERNIENLKTHSDYYSKKLEKAKSKNKTKKVEKINKILKEANTDIKTLQKNVEKGHKQADRLAKMLQDKGERVSKVNRTVDVAKGSEYAAMYLTSVGTAVTLSMLAPALAPHTSTAVAVSTYQATRRNIRNVDSYKVSTKKQKDKAWEKHKKDKDNLLARNVDLSNWEVKRWDEYGNPEIVRPQKRRSK